jgi:hypothetical protein
MRRSGDNASARAAQEGLVVSATTPSDGSARASPPDVAEAQRIAGIENPVIRNLEITECYARLAAGMATRAPACSNWCTYATWASRQAGATIRGEDLVDELERELGRDAELAHPLASLWRWLIRRGLFQRQTWLGRLMADLHTPFDAFERASDAVADGNRKVFAEIGVHFARYLHETDASLGADSPKFARFLDGFTPGEPPDGQRYLREAFTRYQRQHSEPNPRRRAQSIVLANLEIGLHEQTRLQPQIRAAIDAAIPQHDPGWRLLRRKLQRELSELSRVVITRRFMVLTLPGAVLALGRNLDMPFPEQLRSPDDPELVALLARYEPVPPALDDCAAHDWSELTQRMHYIAHLFRACHEDPQLATAPFTPQQVAQFRAGVVPEGDL